MTESHDEVNVAWFGDSSMETQGLVRVPDGTDLLASDVQVIMAVVTAEG